MRIPSENTRHMVTGHGAVTRDDVLDVASEQVAVVRQAVSKRRAVVEDVLRAAFRLLKAGLKCVIGLPEFLDFQLHIGEAGRPSGHVDLGVDIADVRGGVTHQKILHSFAGAGTRLSARGTTPLGR